MIELDEVSVQLGERLVLDRIGMRCGRGELIAVLGPNGAGKTTLLRAIAGLTAAEGHIRLAGQSARDMSGASRARTVAYLPQGNIAHWPISVRDAVAIGRIPHGGGPGRERAADTKAIDVALAATDAAHLAGRPVTELSSGERARVMLARALAVEAPVLLADEPIAALDPAHQLGVLALLGRTAAAGATVLAVLHDLTLAARFSDRVLVLDGGRIVADGAPLDVLDEALLDRVFGVSALHLQHDGKPVLVPWLTQADLHR